MRQILEQIAHTVAIGVGATAIMDLWAALQNRLFGARSMNYALLGRWLGHLTHGTFRHRAIADAPRIAGERIIGWTAHYLVGIVFAAILLAAWGMEWAHQPALGPALIVGVATIVFPFFILQPAFGAGVASSRMPRANRARLRSLVTHTSFGLGLYFAARLVIYLKAY